MSSSPADRPGPDPAEDGGDAVCRLDRVCPACGRLDDGPPPERCPGCGAPVDAAGR